MKTNGPWGSNLLGYLLLVVCWNH